uniref:Minor capsid protein L2 n=1 Tax=Human papillomavirus TaxID=10566 RepID=A0A385PNF4_9PAPI|nr:MAG: L2 protein [Human papillomavirus]
MYKVRRKRAAPEDLYRTCATGDCPEDVKNKIEQNTWADRLLKWFSSILYFGNLGIGTGRGSGGSLGYRPINAPTRQGTIGTIPLRPTVPIESLGPREFIPVDAIQPTSSSVIPEVTIIDPSVVDIARPTDTLGAGEVDVLPDAVSENTGVSGHPVITTAAETDAAVLEVQPVQPPIRAAIDPGFTGDSTHINIVTATLHPTPDINVFVDSSYGGETVGYEEIPLEDFSNISQFSIEEPPQTSTPSQQIDRLATQARRFYNRFTQQVPVHYPEFLGQVSRLAQFEFTNPAFDPDVTVTFERDLQAIESAPAPEFQDIRSLSRPYFAETAERAVRVSRLGTRGTMITRSGLQLGQPVHFYFDLSPIPSAETVESIELQPLGEYSGSNIFVDGQAESTLVTADTNNIAEELFNETDLIDPQDENFRNAHLMIATDENNESISLPSYIPSSISFNIGVNTFGVNIYNPKSTTSDIIIPNVTPTTYPITPIFPGQYIAGLGVDYYLDPALIPRKKRKIDLFNF